MSSSNKSRDIMFPFTPPDAPPSQDDIANLRAAVNMAVNEIDSVEGPRDPANPANPLYPGWLRMSKQEKIRAVVDTMDADPTIANNLGSLTIRFEKEVRDAYERKHRRNR